MAKRTTSGQPRNKAAAEKASSVAHITDALNENIAGAVNAERQFVENNAPEGAVYLKSLREAPLSAPMETSEIVLPVAGDVSAGKSSVLCSLCKYPIIPAAIQTTSICAVEIRKVSSPKDEKLEICLLTDSKTALRDKATRVFKNQRLNDGLFNELKEYALSLISGSALSVEDTLNYFTDANGNLDMTPDNWRHSMVLLMILFDTYVHQDNPDRDATLKAINEKRTALFKALRVPLNKDYGIKLYWCSDFIPENTAIVDLPGTGSATEDSGNMAGHTRLVSNYISRAPSLLFLINQSGLVGSKDAKNVIDTFLTTNEMKGSSSARLSFVINKADTLTEGVADNSKVITTINTFRRTYSDKFPSYDKYSVYTISARSGEINYIDSDISCRNTHIAPAKIKAITETAKMLGFTPTEEMIDTAIKNSLSESYGYKYPYQLASGEDFGEMDLGEFFRKFFSECSERLRFLGIIKSVKNHGDVIENFYNILIQEKLMAETSKKFGKECAVKLSAAIRTALDRSTEEIMGQFNSIEEELDGLFLGMRDRFSEVCRRFNSDYTVLSNKINNELMSTVANMEKQKNGEIPIDGNLIRSNQIGLNNRKKLIEFCESVAEYDFISFFKNGFEKLEHEISLETRAYGAHIDRVCEILGDFPDTVSDYMEKEFALLTKDEAPDVALSYIEPVENARRSTGKLLSSFSNSVINDIRQDQTVQNEIDETLAMIQTAFLELLTPYTNKDFYKDFINSVSKHRLFRANVISTPDLKKFISEQYIEKFEENLTESLDGVLLGRDDTASSHISRMKAAISQVNKTHVSSSRLLGAANKACAVTTEHLESPAHIVKWLGAINSAMDGLDSFFAQDSLFAYLSENRDSFSGTPWLREDIEGLIEMTCALREKTSVRS